MPDRTSARSPYCLPYVSPSDRVSTPLSQEKVVSQRIWQLNQEYFQSIKPAVLLKEANEGFRRLMQYVGFSLNTPMSEICQWHSNRLKTA